LPTREADVTRVALLSAITTGCFCAVFAVFVDVVTDVLTMTQAIAAAAISGFLGSLFAHLLLGRGKGEKE